MKNAPVPLQLGPCLDSMADEKLKLMKSSHSKEVADLQAKLLQARVSDHSEHRDEKEKLQDELEGYKLQCQSLSGLIARRNEEDEKRKEEKQAAGPKARATSQPPISIQHFDIGEESPQEADEANYNDAEMKRRMMMRHGLNTQDGTMTQIKKVC